jgi:NADPH:quinone reductase-like Zn-dependent oxidoreductase
LSAAYPAGIDAAIHLVGDGLVIADLLGPGGRLASTIGLASNDVAGRDVQVTPVMAMPLTATLEAIAADVVSGKLVVPVQRTYPLEAVPEAIADFGCGTLGKLAVTVE